jgi:hypothetical protein
MLRALTKIVRSGCNPRSLAPNIPNQVRALCDIPGPPKDPLKELQKLMEDVGVKLKDCESQLKGATGSCCWNESTGCSKRRTGCSKRRTGCSKRRTSYWSRALRPKVLHCATVGAHVHTLLEALDALVLLLDLMCTHSLRLWMRLCCC